MTNFHPGDYLFHPDAYLAEFDIFTGEGRARPLNEKR
jgi:hypothetical protein